MDIQALIDSTVANGGHSCTVTGEHTIYKTIRIPSDFTLVLDDCHLTMADNTFCMMFCNASLGTPASHTLAGADRRIAIEGRGRAILDGGNYNGFSGRDSLKNGNPHITANNTILFANVEDFRISGLHIRNHRYWAIDLVHCRRGVVRDIDFRADCTWVDENGAHHQGLAFLDEIDHWTDKAILRRNTDGIDLRAGCHDILIGNITGFCVDDTVALTGLTGSTEKLYNVEDDPTDIFNVAIRNVNTATYCANVRLFCQSGVKLYNILVDGVFDASSSSPYMGRGWNGVIVGDTYPFRSSTRLATPDELHDITVRNVYSRARRAVRLSGGMTNVTLDNINGFDGCQTPIDKSTATILTR
jgi:hypothetical protein